MDNIQLTEDEIKFSPKTNKSKTGETQDFLIENSKSKKLQKQFSNLQIQHKSLESKYEDFVSSLQVKLNEMKTILVGKYNSEKDKQELMKQVKTNNELLLNHIEAIQQLISQTSFVESNLTNSESKENQVETETKIDEKPDQEIPLVLTPCDPYRIELAQSYLSSSDEKQYQLEIANLNTAYYTEIFSTLSKQKKNSLKKVKI